MDNLNIALILLAGSWLVIAYLNKQGVLERYNISAFGPILMIRTMRGQKLLSVLARPRRFWKFFGSVGIPMMVIGMVFMFALIILTDYAMLQMLYDNAMPEPGKYNALQNIFLIPGVNEFIPLVWGAIGLLVTLVVHELAHAVLCKVEGVDVKSMGALLLAVIPIGGFAEPDEEQLFGTKKDEKSSSDARVNGVDGVSGADSAADWAGYDRRRSTRSGSTGSAESIGSAEPAEPVQGVARTSRMRILAAGVMMNFVVALIAFALFFGPVIGGIEVVSDVTVVSVDQNSPAAQAGIEKDMVITKVDDTPIRSTHDFYRYMVARPDTPMVLHAKDRETRRTFTISEQDAAMQSGVVMWRVVPNSSAADANITEGMTITMINETRINSTTEFITFLNATVPGQAVEVFFAENNSTTVTLGSSPDRDCGYMGVVATTKLEFAGMTIGGYPASERLHILKNIPTMLDRVDGWVLLFALPFIGFDSNGFSGFGATMQFHEPVGWAAGYGTLVFWIANALLWIGWINFYAGLFNCLPAVPLDGGHIFKDLIHSLFERVVSDRGAEQIAKTIAVAFAVLILSSFVFMIFGPAIVHGL